MADHIVTGIDKDAGTGDLTLDKSVLETDATREFYYLRTPYVATKIQLREIRVNIDTWVVEIRCVDIDNNAVILTTADTIYSTIGALKIAQGTVLGTDFDAQDIIIGGKDFVSPDSE